MEHSPGVEHVGRLQGPEKGLVQRGALHDLPVVGSAFLLPQRVRRRDRILVDIEADDAIRPGAHCSKRVDAAPAAHVEKRCALQVVASEKIEKVPP